MYKKLASYIMAGWPQAATAVAGFGVLALLLPPFTLLSGAALGLVVLRLGAGRGLLILAVAVVLFSVLSLMATGQARIGLAYGLFVWGPLLGLALILRRLVSLAFTVQTAVILGLIAVLAVHALVPGIVGYWHALLEQLLKPVLTQTGVPPDRIDVVVANAARLMTGQFVTSLIFTQLVMLFIARWWQALLYRPGGFREEFTQLNLGQPAAIGATIIIAAVFLTRSGLVLELGMVALSGFFLQGVAIVHFFTGRAARPMLWLVAFYALMLVLPQAVLLVSIGGLVDTFTNFRSRLGGRGKGISKDPGD